MSEMLITSEELAQYRYRATMEKEGFFEIRECPILDAALERATVLGKSPNETQLVAFLGEGPRDLGYELDTPGPVKVKVKEYSYTLEFILPETEEGKVLVGLPDEGHLGCLYRVRMVEKQGNAVEDTWQDRWQALRSWLYVQEWQNWMAGRGQWENGVLPDDAQ